MKNAIIEFIKRLRPPHVLIPGLLVMYLLNASVDMLIMHAEDRFPNSDLYAYLTGAEIIKQGNIHNLYNVQEQRRIQEEYIFNEKLTSPYLLTFRSPPIVAIPFIALRNLPNILAYKIIGLVNLTLTIASIILLTITLKEWRTLIPLILFLPITNNLHYGNITPLVFFILVLIFITLRSNKPLWVGVLTGLLFIKLQYLIIIPFLWIILKKHLNFYIGLCGTLIVLILSNIFIYGRTSLVEWLKFVVRSEDITMGTNVVDNMNLFAFTPLLNPIFKSHTTLFITIVSIVSYLGIVWLLFKNRKKFSLDIFFSIAILSILGLNMHTMYGELTFLTIPLMIFAKNYFKEKTRIILALTCMMQIMPTIISMTRLTFIGPMVLIGISIYLLDAAITTAISSRYTSCQLYSETSTSTNLESE